MGAPSKLKSSVTDTSFGIPDNTFFKHASTPLYHIFPLLKGVMGMLTGVPNKVRLSLGRKLRPDKFKMDNNSFIAIFVIL